MKFLTTMAIIFTTMTYADVPDFIQQCMDCHGPAGVSQHQDIPTIAGASSAFIEETFAAYQYDMRKEVKSKYRFGDTSRRPTSMKKIAKQLSEAQISQAAEYFAELPFIAVKQPFDAELAKQGENLHAEKCEKCHTNGGRSASEDAGILAGQWTPYLRSAMAMILERRRDVDERMVRRVKQLSDDEWNALLNYYASQQD